MTVKQWLRRSARSGFLCVFECDGELVATDGYLAVAVTRDEIAGIEVPGHAWARETERRVRPLWEERATWPPAALRREEIAVRDPLDRARAVTRLLAESEGACALFDRELLALAGALDARARLRLRDDGSALAVDGARTAVVAPLVPQGGTVCATGTPRVTSSSSSSPFTARTLSSSTSSRRPPRSPKLPSSPSTSTSSTSTTSSKRAMRSPGPSGRSSEPATGCSNG